MKRYLWAATALLFVSSSPVTAQDIFGGGFGTSDWSGRYVSGGLGFGRLASSSTAGGPTISVSDTRRSMALAVGHQIQQGTLVYGGEAAIFDVTGDLGAAGSGLGVDYGLRLNARAGYDLGPALAYGSLGLARVDLDGAGFDGSENAVAIGVGIDRQVSPQLTVGAEYFHYRFGDVDNAGGGGAPAEVTLNTLNFKLSYGF